MDVAQAGTGTRRRAGDPAPVWLRAGVAASAILAGCPGSKTIDTAAKPSGDTGVDQVWQCLSVDCRCNCTAPSGDSFDKLIPDVCLPVDAVSAEDYCSGTICPILATMVDEALGESGKECGTSCSLSGDIDGDGHADGVGAVQRDHHCGTCDDVQCHGKFNMTSGLTDDNWDTCTFANSDATCGGSSGSTVKFCRSGMEPLSAECVQPGADTGGSDTASDATSPPSPRPWFGVLPSPLPHGGLASQECESGRGTFLLVPDRSFDRNRDGESLQVLRPIQVSGTGRLTDDAWMTWLGGTYPSMGGLLALKPGRPARVGFGDFLLDQDDVAVRVPSAPAKFPSGTVGGGAPFVALGEQPEVLPAVNFALGLWSWSPPSISQSVPWFTREGSDVALPARMVDIGWTCPVGSETALAPAGRGQPSDLTSNGPRPTPFHASLWGRQTYEFSLGEVGCAAEWPQRFTMRIAPAGTHPRLVVELLGNPDARRVVELRPISGGQGFSFSFNSAGVVLTAQLLGADESSAVMKVIEVSYAGIPMCVPGTYFLKASN